MMFFDTSEDGEDDPNENRVWRLQIQDEETDQGLGNNDVQPTRQDVFATEVPPDRQENVGSRSGIQELQSQEAGATEVPPDRQENVGSRSGIQESQSQEAGASDREEDIEEEPTGRIGFEPSSVLDKRQKFTSKKHRNEANEAKKTSECSRSGIQESQSQEDGASDREEDNEEEPTGRISFEPSSVLYERQKYTSKKRRNEASDDDDGLTGLVKLEKDDNLNESPATRRKVRAAVYRNATGSTYYLNAVYGKMKGSVRASGAVMGQYRPVAGEDGSRSPEQLGDARVESAAENDTRKKKPNLDQNKYRSPKVVAGAGKQPSSNDDEWERLMEIVETEILDTAAISVTWNDIAGLTAIKKTIQEIVVWPMLRPDLFTGLRAPPKGLLLFGPPGTGKTTLGRCIASQAHATFYCISASSLTSKWVGENEKLVRALFQSARAHQPAVIFVDEVDALLSNRTEGEHDSTRRLKTQFFTELDGAKTSSDERILVVGATNRPGDLDDAARRRFTKRLYVPLPDCVGRVEMLGNLLKRESHSLDPEIIQSIAEKTEGFSCDDLTKMCQEAALGPVRKLTDISSASSAELAPILAEDFENALRLVRPSVGKEQLAQYEEFDHRFGSLGAVA